MSFSYNRSYLMPVDSNELIYFVNYATEILAYKYDYDGNTLWQNPISIYACSQTEYISDLAIVKNGQNVLLAWNSSSNGLLAKVVDASGQNVWAGSGLLTISTDGNINQISLQTDGSGGCYYVYRSRESSPFQCHKIRVQHSTAIGALWNQAVLLDDVPIYDPEWICVWDFFLATQLNGSVYVSWYDIRNQLSGIYSQGVNQTGGLLYAQSGIATITGIMGSISYPAIAVAADKAFVFWIKYPSELQTTTDYNGELYFQVVNYNGVIQYPSNGISLNSGVNTKISKLQAKTTPDSKVIISWLENNANGYSLKAQMLDSDSNQLWEQNGKVIVNSSAEIKEYAISFYNEAVYFIWYSDYNSAYDRIFGQKLVNGNIQWVTSGKQLVTTNPALASDDYTAIKIKDNHICWVSQHYGNDGYYTGRTYCMSIDANGNPITGYNVWGNPVADVLSMYVSQSYQDFYLVPEGQIYILNNWFVYEDPHIWVNYADPYLQTLTTSGSQQLGIYGIALPSSGMYIYDESYLYNYYDYTNNISKFDLDLTQLWIHNAEAYLPEVYQFIIKRLTGQRFLLCRYGSNSGSNTLIHSYFDSAGNIFNPANNILWQDGVFRLMDIAVNSDEAFVLWSVYTKGTYILEGAGYNQIFVHKVNNGDVGITDDYVHPIQIPSSLCFPNPFTDNTAIAIELKQPADCELNIYNTKGQIVKTLHKGKLNKGTHRITWDGRDKSGTVCADGVYFYKLTNDDQVIIKKMIKLH